MLCFSTNPKANGIFPSLVLQVLSSQAPIYLLNRHNFKFDNCSFSVMLSMLLDFWFRGYIYSTSTPLMCTTHIPILLSPVLFFFALPPSLPPTHTHFITFYFILCPYLYILGSRVNYVSSN